MPVIYAVKATGPSDAVVYEMTTRQLTHSLTVTRDFEPDHHRPTLDEVLRSIPDPNPLGFLLPEALPANLWDRLHLEQLTPRSPDVCY